jgi:hypothetical protein
MNKKLKIFLIVLAVFVVAGFIGYNYVMHGGARDLSAEDAVFTVSSKDITAEFTADIEKANKKYLEKAVAVSGTVSGINGNDITLDQTIVCSFKNQQQVKINTKITVKGRIVGYDDLLGEVRLDQCNKINN